MTTASMPDPASAEGRAILQAIRQETASAVRSALFAAFAVDEPMPEQGVTIAQSSIDAIEAQMVFDIYNARRRARLALLGLEPVPEPSAEAVELFQRVRQTEPVPA
jgi:hypothetical protein